MKYRDDRSLFGRCVFGDTLCSLGDGVLGEFSGKDESHGCLNLSRGDRRLLVVKRKLRSFGSDSLKDINHKRVHD